MRTLHNITLCLAVLLFASAAGAAGPLSDYGIAAQRLLEHAKYQEPADAEITALQTATPEELYASLDSDTKKKAFWLNIYNSLAYLELLKNPQLYADKKEFFSRKTITIAGRALSLDDIEHRMLRRAKPGFLPRFLRPLFMSPFMRRLSVSELDPRIHFALNCNARSCPPILFYEAGTLDAQLDAAACNYLSTSVACDPATGRVELPELFRWFAADFGDEQGITVILQKCAVINPALRPIFDYKPWDWTPEPGRFQ